VSGRGDGEELGESLEKAQQEEQQRSHGAI
jgi:hypothetical protein